MWEAIIAALGVIATGLTFLAKQKAALPLENKVKRLQIEKKEMLDNYAKALGRLKTLEKVVIRQREKLYEKMDTNDLADAWNELGMRWDDKDPDDSN